MKNITLIALKRITYIIPIHIRLCHLLFAKYSIWQVCQLLAITGYCDRLSEHDSQTALANAIMTPNHIRTLATTDKGSHPTYSSISILEQPIRFFIPNLNATHCLGHLTFAKCSTIGTHRQSMNLSDSQCIPCHQFDGIGFSEALFVCLSHPMNREVLVTKSIKKHCKIA